MLKTDDSRLSEDQKQLVEAFNEVTKYIESRLLGNNSVFDDAFSIEELTKRHKGEQANSAIADEAVEFLRMVNVSEPELFSQALKRGGTTTELARYFVEEVQLATQDSVKTEIAEQAKAKVIKELLFESSAQQALPAGYIKDEAQRLGFIPKL